MEHRPPAREGETALSPQRKRDQARVPKEEARGGTMGSPTARPRVVIVVTGSELVRGERTDLNGPFLAGQALSLGLEPARITIVGDRPDEIGPGLPFVDRRGAQRVGP